MGHTVKVDFWVPDKHVTVEHWAQLPSGFCDGEGLSRITKPSNTPFGKSQTCRRIQAIWKNQTKETKNIFHGFASLVWRMWIPKVVANERMVTNNPNVLPKFSHPNPWISKGLRWWNMMPISVLLPWLNKSVLSKHLKKLANSSLNLKYEF